jgi:hypothetical protein
MPKKTDTTSVFRSVALLIAVSLLSAIALVYLQGQGGGGSAAELAALSQSIPARTADALTGRARAFDVLEANVGRLAELRRGAGVPGNSADWQQLESRASAILARRPALEAVNGVYDSTAAILELSNENLTRSGSTAAVQEFQRRARDIANMAAGLSTDTDSTATLSAMAENTAYLRAVSDALSGEESAFDIVALDEAGRAAVLEPLAGHISNLEAQVATVGSNAGQLTGLDAAQAEVAAAANKLADAFAGAQRGASGLLPAFLMTPSIPAGLMVLGIVLRSESTR